MADFTFSNKSGSSNFAPNGDKNNEIFGDLLLNRTELEAYLTSLRRRQRSATPPVNPNTGDIWECSTTGGGYTADIVYRYNGSAWAEATAAAMNIPNRNTVLQGKVDISGNPALFEAGTGLAVKLNATATPAVFAFMNGNSATTGAVDLIASISADSAAFWSSLPTTSTVFLYVDYNSGTPSGGFTTVAPVYQNYAPAHSAGLHWFDFNTGKVWSSDGSAWTQRNRIIVGTATTDGTEVTAVNVYPYNDYKGSASNYLPSSYLDTDGTLAANSDSKIATQKAVKTYVDSLPTPSGGASIGTGNYIAEPFSVVPGTGLEVLVNPNRCVIDETAVESASQTPVALTAKAAQLVFKKKDGTYDKQLPKMTAADLVDANTVGLWFPDGSASVANAAVGVNGNTLAVANALTKSGTITAVDGWAGGDAAKGDGSTGYYTLSNNTGIPLYANPAEVVLLFTCGTLGSFQILYHDYCHNIFLSSTGEIGVSNNSGADTYTGYICEAGKIYLAHLQSTSGTGGVFVNGNLIYSGVNAKNTTINANPKILRHVANADGYSTSTIHFVEIRNALRTPAQIAALAQKLLIPCQYGDTDIRDALTNKAESQVVAFARTSATVPTLIVAPNNPKGATPDWAYGMRIGPNGVLNKTKRLGRKAFSDSATPEWDAPFGSRNMTLNAEWSLDATGTNSSQIPNDAANSYPSILINGKIRETITTGVQVAGVQKTSGYVDIIAEVQD